MKGLKKWTEYCQVTSGILTGALFTGLGIGIESQIRKGAVFGRQIAVSRICSFMMMNGMMVKSCIASDSNTDGGDNNDLP